MTPLARASHRARVLLERALDVLAPRGCAACDALVDDGAPFCASCRATVGGPRESSLAGAPVFAGAAYGGALAAAVQRFKYRGRAELAPALTSLVEAATPRGWRAEGALLVPVPLHPARLAERGYNQSALLAGRLARRIGGASAPLALARTRATEQQAGRAPDARVENVSGAFVARTPERLRGRRVVLVDDVVTTGATARACAEALSESGARLTAIMAVALAGLNEGAGGDDR
ncbi:MAG: phosphoribosyltransferase family protein [Polyangiaceae bacterium]|nr:phosphoribosyltransferase family protein [Polyangiaceae bacterium]